MLRDVIDNIAGIHFTSSGELHTLSSLYESMPREMRDAAGDSGEFYTPRAVVRFMVAVSDPRLGETVLDPAAGTAGFLVAALNYLGPQVKTVADRKMLQERSLLGCEAKQLPYLLCQMNLLLHGLDAHRVQADQQYPNFGIYSFGRGLFHKQPISGTATRATTLYRVRMGQFIYSRLFAFEGA